MKKKLFLLCLLSVMLAGLLAVPAPVSAGCPTSCPLPGNPQSYCTSSCMGEGCSGDGCQLCIVGCENSLYGQAQQLCQSCDVCCTYPDWRSGAGCLL